MLRLSLLLSLVLPCLASYSTAWLPPLRASLPQVSALPAAVPLELDAADSDERRLELLEPIIARLEASGIAPETLASASGRKALSSAVGRHVAETNVRAKEILEEFASEQAGIERIEDNFRDATRILAKSAAFLEPERRKKLGPVWHALERQVESQEKRLAGLRAQAAKDALRAALGRAPDRASEDQERRETFQRAAKVFRALTPKARGYVDDDRSLESSKAVRILGRWTVAGESLDPNNGLTRGQARKLLARLKPLVEQFKSYLGSDARLSERERRRWTSSSRLLMRFVGDLARSPSSAPLASEDRRALVELVSKLRQELGGLKPSALGYIDDSPRSKDEKEAARRAWSRVDEQLAELEARPAESLDGIAEAWDRDLLAPYEGSVFGDRFLDVEGQLIRRRPVMDIRLQLSRIRALSAPKPAPESKKELERRREAFAQALEMLELFLQEYRGRLAPDAANPFDGGEAAAIMRAIVDGEEPPTIGRAIAVWEKARAFVGDYKAAVDARKGWSADTRRIRKQTADKLIELLISLVG